MLCLKNDVLSEVSCAMWYPCYLYLDALYYISNFSFGVDNKDFMGYDFINKYQMFKCNLNLTQRLVLMVKLSKSLNLIMINEVSIDNGHYI